MSETPTSPGELEPTLRIEPTGSAPAASEPTASPTEADITHRLSPDAPAPSYPTTPTPVPPAPLAPTPPAAVSPPAPAPTSGAMPTSGGWGGEPGYPPAYPQPGYPPAYPQAGYQPGYPPAFDAQGRPLSDKSKVVAGVLGILLGGFGVGRFYTGHIGMGIGQLVLTLMTCGFGSLWGLIDGIVILVNGGTDSDGRVLRD